MALQFTLVKFSDSYILMYNKTPSTSSMHSILIVIYGPWVSLLHLEYMHTSIQLWVNVLMNLMFFCVSSEKTHIPRGCILHQILKAQALCDTDIEGLQPHVKNVQNLFQKKSEARYRNHSYVHVLDQTNQFPNKSKST